MLVIPALPQALIIIESMTKDNTARPFLNDIIDLYLA
jgi:hypothetical protein